MAVAVENEALRESITEFIISNFLFGDRSVAPAADTSLMGVGVVDSTGILELIEFLESEFGIQVADDETTPANLDSVERLAAFVSMKTVAA